MSMREVYTCDVCRDVVDRKEVYGCNFTGMKNFKLSDPVSTKGVHICYRCLKQLEVQIPETKASVTYVPPDNGEGRS